MRASMSGYRALPKSFYQRPADQVAPDLLGRYLVRQSGELRLVVRIVETEAYLGATDRASHAWNGRRTPRNESLYQPGGVAYVYFIYGMYYCLNAVTGSAKTAGAVLIRAAEPLQGHDVMAQHRGLTRPAGPGDLTGGPGKLCQALRIDRDCDGLSLQRGSLTVTGGEPIATTQQVTGPRIGIDYAEEAVEWPLRFAESQNRHVSKPYPWNRKP